MTILRPYQLQARSNALTELTAAKSTLIECATGLGKTVIFAHLARDWPGRVLIIAHRDELIRQAAEKVHAITGQRAAIEMGREKATDELFGTKITVASIQTLARANRRHRFHPDHFSLVVVDEGHHATAISYREVLQYFGSAKVLFVTATPKRADDVALRSICETVAFSYGIESAIDDGWLVPVKQVVVKVDGLDFSRARTVAEDFNAADLDKILTEEKPLHAMVASAHELLGTRQALWFCNTVQHARLTAEVLMRYAPREQVTFLSGDTPREERREAVDAYKAGNIQHMLNCSLFLEGFDAPSTSGIVMGRPTKSIGLYTQVLGRGTRPLPGIVDGIEHAELRRQAIAMSEKPNMLVVDFCGNAGRHKIVQAGDVLGGKHEPAEREYARETMKAEGEPVDIEESLERAKCELALLDEENQRRRHIKANSVNYRVTEISPFTRQYQGKNGKETKYNPPAAERCSTKQAGLLCYLSRETGGNWKFDAASRLTKKQAGRIINVLTQLKQQRGVS